MDTTKITNEKVESVDHDLNVGDMEDVDLWAAVLAHETYKQSHLNESSEIHDTPEKFLRATSDHLESV
jgi:hypothetical protein